MATAEPSLALVGAMKRAAALAGGDAFPTHTPTPARRNISMSFSASPANEKTGVNGGWGEGDKNMGHLNSLEVNIHSMTLDVYG